IVGVINSANSPSGMHYMHYHGYGIQGSLCCGYTLVGQWLQGMDGLLLYDLLQAGFIISYTLPVFRAGAHFPGMYGIETANGLGNGKLYQQTGQYGQVYIGIFHTAYKLQNLIYTF